jgi:hypothetical protein
MGGLSAVSWLSVRILPARGSCIETRTFIRAEYANLIDLGVFRPVKAGRSMIGGKLMVAEPLRAAHSTAIQNALGLRS